MTLPPTLNERASHDVVSAVSGSASTISRSISNVTMRQPPELWLRTGAGPANMTTIRHAALDIVGEMPDQAGLKVRRKTRGRDADCLLAALTQPPP